MLDFIAFPMGQFLNFIYNTMAFKYYGLAIIIFTLFIRLFLLPLYIKQYRSTAKLQEIQPLIQEIQKRYKNDKEKLNQEMMKVYQENKANPAGGCLPLIVQMPILFSLFYVISQPLKYMLQVGVAEKVLLPGREAVSLIDKAITQLLAIVPKGESISVYSNINIINFFNNHPDRISEAQGLLNSSDLLNMNFLGLNLGLQPTWNTSLIFGNLQYLALLLIPILAAVTTYLSVKFSTPQTSSGSANKAANPMGSSMMMIMPFMTAFFAFSVPAGMGLYWIVGNVIQILQQLYMNKFIIKKKEVVNK